MEYIPTNLANGVLGTVSATLATIPTNASAMMRSIILVNKTASEVQVSIRAKFGAGGTARCVVPPNMRLPAYSKFDDNSVIILPADSIVEGECDTGAAVDYIISGVISV